MWKRWKKTLSFIMMCGFVFGASFTRIAATNEDGIQEDGYQKTDTYILNFSGQNIEGYEEYDAKRLYASDHYAGLYVDEDGDGVNEAVGIGHALVS